MLARLQTLPHSLHLLLAHILKILGDYCAVQKTVLFYENPPLLAIECQMRRRVVHISLERVKVCRVPALHFLAVRGIHVASIEARVFGCT
jgi:hypothetical protein